MYEVSILGDLPGGGTSTGGYSINNLGEAVGISNASTGWRATLWNNGSITDLGDLPGGSDYSVAMSINDAGQIAGIGYSVNYRAVLWQNGTITDLGTLSGTFSEANGINAVGQVVGASDDPFLN
jgi:probable HAF family extracellular repeat protein